MPQIQTTTVAMIFLEEIIFPKHNETIALIIKFVPPAKSVTLSNLFKDAIKKKNNW
jgi:hypothetical protein